LCVALRDPSTRIVRVFPPGGALEPGESAAQAAVRETLEETGYAVRLQAREPSVAAYPYTWNGQLFSVTTHFFAADLIDPGAPPLAVDDESYLEGTCWVELAHVPDVLGFDRAIQAAVLQLLPPQKR